MTTSKLEIRPMTGADAAAVLAIYQAGIDTGDATFESTAPDWGTWDSGHLADHRFVAEDHGSRQVLGWVALSTVSSRCVYAGVVEVSVYVRPEARGRGVGGALLAELIDSTEKAGIWTIQAGVFPENSASVALHLASGFRIVGRRERLGCHAGTWRDVLLLERRSTLVG